VVRARRASRDEQNTIADERAATGLEKPLMLFVLLGMQVIPLVYILSSWLDFADYRLPTTAGLVVGWIGAAVFAVALWLLWRSHADLGRNWSPTLQIREEHSLVTRGVFHHIRHPMYAAHWLWAVAQALLLQNWIAGLAMMAAFLPLYLHRVTREEQMMLEHFGDEYRSYMNRTGRIVPRFRS
jgi:protein-S-isoprenylcysteine O-methyltransferase Ste14